MEVLLGIFLVAAFICVLALTPSYLKSRERMRLIDLVQGATDKGLPIPPEALSVLTAEPKAQRPSHVRDLRRGAVLISVAIAVEIFALCMYLGQQMNEADPGDAAEIAAVAMAIAGVGALPLSMGVAFILLGAIGAKSPEV